MVRKGPVGLEEAAGGVDRQPLEHRRQHRAGHAVCRVDDDPEGLDRLDVHEGEHLLHIGGPDVVRLDAAAGARLRAARDLQGAVSDIEQARCSADRQRAAADDLHAGVVLRIVGGGNGDATVELQIADREIEHLGADEAKLEDVGSSVRGPVAHRCGHRGARHAHVVSDRDLLGLELLDEGAADRIGALLVELRGVDATDVVCL